MYTTKVVTLTAIIISLIIGGCENKIDFDGYSIVYTTVQGQEFKASDSKDKWLIVNYWASWCPPCKKEIQELSKFAALHPNEATVIGVTLEQATADFLPKTLKLFNIEYQVVNHDLINDWFSVDTEAYPSTYIINKDGSLYKTVTGPITQSELEKILFS